MRPLIIVNTITQVNNDTVLGVGGWVITKDKKTFLIQNATWKGI